MTQTWRFLLVLIALLPGLSGCLSSRKPKETTTIAAELEEGFKERWVTKRVGELLLNGAATDGLQARRMALQEFRERYEYLRGDERR